jgi:hypothetical protein
LPFAACRPGSIERRSVRCPVDEREAGILLLVFVHRHDEIPCARGRGGYVPAFAAGDQEFRAVAAEADHGERFLVLLVLFRITRAARRLVSRLVCRGLLGIRLRFRRQAPRFRTVDALHEDFALLRIREPSAVVRPPQLNALQFAGRHEDFAIACLRVDVLQYILGPADRVVVSLFGHVFHHGEERAIA